MGGKPQQVNSAQATQADAAAQQSEQASANLTQQNTKQAGQNYNYLFGEDGKSGSMTPFMDPGKVTNGSGAPTGTYGTIYNNAVQQGGRDYANARGSLAQQWANNGFAGGTPNGFQADQERKLASSFADANGQNYTNLAAQGHQEDVNNFWNASNLAAGQQATSTGAAVSSAANEGNTAANVYGTAGKQATVNNPLNSLISASGTVGAAAMCPAQGGKIRTKRGDVAVEDLSAGDDLLQSDGHFHTLPEDPYSVTAECVDVETSRERKTRVSEGHAFSTNGGGYVDAIASRNQEIRAHHEKDLVTRVTKCGRHQVFVMPKFGNNTYLCDGFWSLT